MIQSMSMEGNIYLDQGISLAGNGTDGDGGSPAVSLMAIISLSLMFCIIGIIGIVGKI